MDNEFIYLDRIQKIKQIINKYGEDNFYISFSGGKDSCVMLKEKPLTKWQKEHKKKISIIGLMRAEEGRRKDTVCLLIRHGYIKSFHPLAPLTKDWEEWYINEHNVKICDIYKPPYNFARTGCKGCPFARNIQEELDTLEEFFPSERKQCEYIWKPIYNEYRRINYRLKGANNNA